MAFCLVWILQSFVSTCVWFRTHVILNILHADENPPFHNADEYLMIDYLQYIFIKSTYYIPTIERGRRYPTTNVSLHAVVISWSKVVFLQRPTYSNRPPMSRVNAGVIHLCSMLCLQVAFSDEGKLLAVEADFYVCKGSAQNDTNTFKALLAYCSDG